MGLTSEEQAEIQRRQVKLALHRDRIAAIQRQATERDRAAARDQQVELNAQLAGLPAHSAIQFEIARSGRRYAYVAIKARSIWFLTGVSSLLPRSCDSAALARAIIGHGAQYVHAVTSYTSVWSA